MHKKLKLMLASDITHLEQQNHEQNGLPDVIATVQSHRNFILHRQYNYMHQKSKTHVLKYQMTCHSAEFDVS